MSDDVPIDLAKVKAVLGDVNRLTEMVESGTPNARKELLIKTRALFLAVETPLESLLRMVWAEPSLSIVLQIAIDLNLFEKLADDGGKPKTTVDLAQAVGAEQDLLSRMLKHLAAMNIIHEVDIDLYSPNPLSLALVEPPYRDAIPLNFEYMRYVYDGLRTYLKTSNYTAPHDPLNGAFQIGMKTSQHYFEWMAEHPAEMQYFNNFMSGYSLSRKRWMEPGCVDMASILGTPDTLKAPKPLGNPPDNNDDAVLLVDIGGGNGHDLRLFHHHHPTLPGRLILQDLAPTVASAQPHLPPPLEALPHDFFTPQPIPHARAYFLHSILHDWPTPKCREILANIVPAMDPAYSKILINELIVPDRNASSETTGLDFVMMAIFAAKERRESEWREIIEGVVVCVGDDGARLRLKVVRVWRWDGSEEGLLEVELVHDWDPVGDESGIGSAAAAKAA